ncbi:MAG TPA: hypothetical protein VFD27_10735 [Chthoniobacteraceae bacterium]|nr:hypothetical protein [Chthoniobacteraceae bacterium]
MQEHVDSIVVSDQQIVAPIPIHIHDNDRVAVFQRAVFRRVLSGRGELSAIRLRKYVELPKSVSHHHIAATVVIEIPNRYRIGVRYPKVPGKCEQCVKRKCPFDRPRNGCKQRERCREKEHQGF